MAVVFDTHEYIKKLEKGGFSPELAEALTDANKQAFTELAESQLATKSDISKLDKELTLVKWVSFATFAIVAAPLIKSLFA